MSKERIVQADVDAREEAQADAFDDSVGELSYYATDTADKVFRAGLLAGMAWVKIGNPGRRAGDEVCGLSEQKMAAEVRKGIADWEEMLHQCTDYNLCFEMAWDRGEILAGAGFVTKEPNSRHASAKLQHQLDQAVCEERYEDAARIRDEIAKTTRPERKGGR